MPESAHRHALTAPVTECTEEAGACRVGVNRLLRPTAVLITRRACRRPLRPMKNDLPDHASRSHRTAAQGMLPTNNLMSRHCVGVGPHTVKRCYTTIIECLRAPPEYFKPSGSHEYSRAPHAGRAPARPIHS